MARHRLRLTKKIPKKIYLALFIVAIPLVSFGVGHFLNKKPAIQNVKFTYTYACTSSSDQESILCLEKEYQEYTEKNGVAASFNKLEAAYKSDPNVQADCHQIAHVIGRTEADMVNNVDAAYAQGNNFCWSGYYHGVMESIVAKIGVNNLPQALPTICAQIESKQPYSFYAYNCVHGLGHGIMNVTNSDLFASLKMCDLLKTNWDQQSCYGGVFMENEMDEVNPDHHTIYFKASDPMYPCTAVGDQYKQQCYLMQTSHALRTVNENFSAVFQMCSKVDTQFVDTCYQSLGRDASGNTSSTVAPTVTNCMYGQNFDAQSNCVVGAVKDFISYYHSDQQANQLCEAFDTQLQPICQSTKTSYYSTF